MSAKMFIRSTFIGTLLGIVEYTSTALANSCANLNVIGTFDESGVQENQYWISELRRKRTKINSLILTSPS